MIRPERLVGETRKPAEVPEVLHGYPEMQYSYNSLYFRLKLTVNTSVSSSLTPWSREPWPWQELGFSPGIVENKKIHIKPALSWPGLPPGNDRRAAA